VARQLSARIGNAYEEAGLTSLEGNIIAVVAASSGPVTVPQVARALCNSRQAVQRGVKDLEAAGLLGTSRNPNHKRSALLQLTVRGQECLDRAAHQAELALQPILGHLDEAEVKSVARDLNRLLQQIEQAILNSEDDLGLPE